MVGNNSDSFCYFFTFSVFFTGQFFDFCNNRSKAFCFINSLFSVHHCYGSFNSHSGINIFLRKRCIFTVFVFVELHKNIIPDFNVFSASTSGTAFVGTSFFACIYKHFCIRTAWTGISGRSPPVVFFWFVMNVVCFDTE